MQPGDSGGRERRYGYGDKTEGECSLGTVVEENGGMDDGDKGDLMEVSAAWGQWWKRTEIRQRVSAAWGQWWRRTEVWIRR